MKKLLLIGIISLIAIYVYSNLTDEQRKYYPPQPEKGKFGAIVKIKNTSAEHATRCTAFIISDELALTAGHCLKVTQTEKDSNPLLINDKVSEYDVIDMDGKNTRIKAIAYTKNTIRDYGFLKGDFSKFESMALDTEYTPTAGDKLQACGYPGASVNIICVDYEVIGTHFFQIIGSSLFVPGISGSPIINKYGEVVGIASSVIGKHALIEPILGILP